MEVKNNYQECITNLACSIRKYFDLDYKHNTLDYIDKLLDEYKPKNVVTILCDGMGSIIMDRILNKDSFLIKNRLKTITTVFPATTVAATTSIETGLNPCETGMLGWFMYFKDIDKIITTFFGTEKGDIEEKVNKDAIIYKNKHMITKSITDEINEKTNYKGYSLFPFGNNSYKDLDDMYNKIEHLCKSDDKKYIYAYDKEPDHSMHEFGCDSEIAQNLIEERNQKIEKLCSKLDDTIVLVIADHGHMNCENIFIEDYPDIMDCLKRDISLEARTVNFFIKDNMHEIFESLFNKYFGNDFDLYSMDEVINFKLFGDGKENEIFRDCLGDYLAIAKSNKALLSHGCPVLKSNHAGYTLDEILIPLIVINKCTKN